MRNEQHLFGLFLFVLSTLSCIPALAGWSHNTSTPSPLQTVNRFTLYVEINNFKADKKYPAKLNVFMGGGSDLATLAKDTINEGENTFHFQYEIKNINFSGIGEVVVPGIGAFPCIIKATNNSPNLALDTGNLKHYMPPAKDNENAALGIFLTIYKGYENMLSHYAEEMVSPFGQFSSDSGVYNRFLSDYISFRKQLNLFFQYAKNTYPNTYVSQHLQGLFLQNIQFTSLTGARDAYFKDWDFGDSSILNNPLFDRQIAIYKFIAACPLVRDMDKETDALFDPLQRKPASATVADHVQQYWLIQMLKENTDGHLDLALEHFYNRWLSNEFGGCSEEANASENQTFKRAFYKRLANISSVAEGKPMPNISGLDGEGQKINLQQLCSVSAAPFTLVLVWSSTCSHCEQLMPSLVSLARQNENKLQVLAYSIDKKTTATNWTENVKQRAGLKNWKDIAELDDMGSTGISHICYMGTPSLFLLNKAGNIISKTTDLNTINQKLNFTP